MVIIIVIVIVLAMVMTVIFASILVNLGKFEESPKILS